MTLHNNLITLSHESIKQYGSSGAIILQVLYQNFGSEIKIDTERWHKDILDFVAISAVKATLTIMETKGHVTIDGNILTILDQKKKVEKKVKIKKVREPNPQWEFAEVLCEVFKENAVMSDPKKWLRFVKLLVKAGWTKETIWERYGEETGFWYTQDWRGLQGDKPNMATIKETLDTETKVTKKKVKKEDNFFR